MSDGIKITMKKCTCDLIDISVRPAKPEFIRGNPRGCQLHGAEVDKLYAAAEWKARYGDDPEMALSAPSEPVQDQPRVWAMPEIPEDVTRLRDNEGSEWTRAEEPERWWERADGRRISAESRLIDERGPLTEVVEPDGD